MKKYDSYKNSGIEWIGDIPSHWKAVPMRFLLRQRITDGPHETPKFLPDGIPFLSVDGIQDGELVFEGCRKISIEDHERYKQKCVVEKHDILMGKAASVGKVAQVKVDFEFSIWSPLALLKPNHEKITSSYFEYFLKSTYAKDNANILSTFNTQQNISMTDIPRIYYIIPNSVEEQTAIAAYLDRKTAEIDELIADKKRLLELYEEEKTAIINQAVTKGINPDVTLKDSGIEWLGEIPEHWEVKRIRHVAQIFGRIGYRGYKTTDLVQKGEGAITISPSNMKGYYMDFSDCSYLSWEKYEESPEIMIQNGDILFVKTGSTYGKSSIVENLPEKATINPQIIVLKEIQCNNKLFWYIIKSEYTQFQVEGTVVGGTIPTISQAKINNYEFVITPDEKEQQAIVEFIDNACSLIDAKKSKTEKLIELLTEYRTALISEVVTGKIKVIE
jgi:type I restriction enzyme S subunit